MLPLCSSKFDDDCIWMIRNAPYLSCPNWEDRRKSLTHIFTFRGRAVKQHVLLFLHTNFYIIECIALFPYLGLRVPKGIFQELVLHQKDDFSNGS